LTPFRYILSHLLDLGRWSYELSFDRYGHDGRQMGKNPTPWTMHPYLIQHLMEDIAPDYAQTPLREVMHDHSTWTLAFLTLDVGLLMMMSCARVC
jgi:hypothetical protein